MDSKKLKKLAPVVIAALAATGWFGTQAVQDNNGSGSNGSSQHQQASSNGGSGLGSNGKGGSGNGNGSSGKLDYADGDECTYDTLPVEAQEQIEDILDGAAPDHGHHDGKHFGNYEGLLPRENSQYYREYTVTTPGLNHRGERRIVVGGGSDSDPDVWYYSNDHFESFCSIPDAEG